MATVTPSFVILGAPKDLSNIIIASKCGADIFIDRIPTDPLALDGVSLTVNVIDKTLVDLMIIPHTVRTTGLSYEITPKNTINNRIKNIRTKDGKLLISFCFHPSPLP